MDPIERAAIVDEGYDPDNPTVVAELDRIRRVLGEHRHLTADPDLTLEYLVNASKAHESRHASDARR